MLIQIVPSLISWFSIPCLLIILRIKWWWNVRFQSFDDCRQFTYYEESSLCVAFEFCTSFSTDTCTGCISGDATCEALVIAKWKLGIHYCLNLFFFSVSRPALLLAFVMELSLIRSSIFKVRVNARISVGTGMDATGTHSMLQGKWQYKPWMFLWVNIHDNSSEIFASWLPIAGTLRNAKMRSVCMDRSESLA